uniref:Cilia- and flagella-associated protein 97 n=1 Tax=Xenopus tropicalis TaxID=8364 RepID=F6TSJ8_XENTR
MDRYGNLSDDGEVDHSFFDSDVDESANKVGVASVGSNKQENINTNVNKDVNKISFENKQNVMSGEKGRNHVYEEKIAKPSSPSTAAVAPRPDSALKSGRTSAQSLRIEATIPTGIPQIRREFEDNYYPDEEDSSEDECHNSRPKTAKQTNIGKKSTGKSNRDFVSTISSSDTEYSDTGSDDGASKSSYQSSKGSLMRSPERKPSRSSMRELRHYAEESEDTVTDVTPLSTPDISPIQSFDLAATSEVLKSTFKRQENISQEIYDPDNDLRINQKAVQDAVDLNQLLKVPLFYVAFMHLDKKEPSSVQDENPVMHNKKNFSFSNDEVRQIERENQRLLKELTRQAAKPRSKSLTPKKPMSAPTRLYHSAINRQKEQQRIERENMALLKRLESVKPTVGMTRTEQLMDYQRQAGYLSATALSPRPGKASVSRLSPSVSSGGFSRMSSATNRSERTGSSGALLRPTRSGNVRAAWQ